jgi:hypothetical protein
MKRPVKRNRVVVIGIDDQWDVDLMDMTKFSKYNRGYYFILVAIDIFSKYVCDMLYYNFQQFSVILLCNYMTERV